MKNNFEPKPIFSKVEREADIPEGLSWDEEMYYIFYRNGKFHPLERIEWPDGKEYVLSRGIKDGSIRLVGDSPGKFYLSPYLRKIWDKKK